MGTGMDGNRNHVAQVVCIDVYRVAKHGPRWLTALFSYLSAAYDIQGSEFKRCIKLLESRGLIELRKVGNLTLVVPR